MLIRRATAILRGLVEGRVVVGAAAAALAAVAGSLLGASASLPLLAAIAAATVIIYDLDELLDRRGGRDSIPPVVPVTLGLGVGLLAVTLPGLRGATILAIGLGLPLCIAYAIPCPPLGGRRPKDFPIGKSLFVAVAVTLATVLLPCLESGVRPSGLPLLLAPGWVFAAVALSAIGCDLRDHPTDRSAGRASVVTLLGETRARHGLILGSSGLLLLGAVAVADGHLPGAVLIPFAATAGALRMLGPGAPGWLWGLCLDGIFIPLPWCIG